MMTDDHGRLVQDLARHAATKMSHVVEDTLGLVDLPGARPMLLLETIAMISGESGAAMMIMTSMAAGIDLSDATKEEVLDFTLVGMLAVLHRIENSNTRPTTWASGILSASSRFKDIYGREPKVRGWEVLIARILTSMPVEGAA